MSPPSHYVLVYDGGCPFCTTVAFWVQRSSRRPMDLIAFDAVEGLGVLTELRPEQVEAAAHFITPDGTEYHAGEAVTRALRLTRLGWLAPVMDAPGLSLLRDGGYALTARLRPWLSSLLSRY